MTSPLSVSSSIANSPTTLPSSSRYSISATSSSPISTVMSMPSGSEKSTLLSPFETLTSACAPSADATSTCPLRLTVKEVSASVASADAARAVMRALPTESIDIVTGVWTELPFRAVGDALNDFTTEWSTVTAIPLPDRTAPRVDRAMTPSGRTTAGSVVS